MRTEKIRKYIGELKKMDGTLEEFDEGVFIASVDKILVKTGSIRVLSYHN